MDYELHVLRAAADGVQPALLLRAPGKKAEYLFNVPDGFSRLALEQKLIPSARLSCVLLTSLLPASTGGFGGLFLRLKHDGHGQVQVIGPQGSSSIIHSLRHICRWQHPKVFVSECRVGQRPIPVFEDEYTAIVPLVAGDQLTGCRWCLYASSESLAANPPKKEVALADTIQLLGNRSSSSSDCSVSGSDNSSDETASSGFVPSASGTDGDSFGKSLSEFNACSGSGKDDRDLKEVLPQQRKRGAGNYPVLDSEEENCGRVMDDLLIVKKPKSCENPFQVSADVKLSVSSSTPKLSLLHDNERTRVLDKGAEPSEEGNLFPCFKHNGMTDVTDVLPASCSGGQQLESSFVQSTKPNECLISNLHQDNLPELEDDSNPVYELHSSGVVNEKNSDLHKTGGKDQPDRNAARVLGYVAHLRKLNTAVLVVDCGGTEDVESLRRHPALSCVYCISRTKKDDETSKMHSISATIHLTHHSLVQSSDYQLWMASLGNPASVVMSESSPEFGFQASLAMLQKLNNVQRDIFPLPFKMVSPNSRTTQLAQELTNSNDTIVDAGHSLCARFCEEGTTWSHVSVENPVHPHSSNAGTAEQVQPELLVAKEAEVPRSNSRLCSQVSPNLLAAIGIKRRLSQKESIVSGSIIMQNSENSPNDNAAMVCPVKNCTRQDCVCRSFVLPLTIEGNQEGSSGCLHVEDGDTCTDGDRAFCPNGPSASPQVVPEDKQVMKVSRNCDLMLPQTRGPNPAQDYLKFHDPASEFQLVFLGTGCAEPSKKRGSSSILLQVRGAEGAMLLDAGEGAAGQLFRRFGEQAARTIISSLQCLWLSHKHGDHALGVLSILQTRSIQAAPLLIIGPHKVGQWLSEVRDTWSAKGYLVPQFTFIHCEQLSKSEQYNQNSQQHRQQLVEVLHAMQMDSMLSVKVFHCYDAYGIILNGRRGWKVVYSGDTRPCKQLIEAGHGCTLLIHEATFEDKLVEQAKCKRHSTVSEAVTVGREMRAQHIILTHFSQRYPEMVFINGGNNENLSVAFDGMVVPSQLLDLLGKLLPQIRIACQRTVSQIPPITDQRSDCSSKPKPVLHGECALQQNYAREAQAARHKRWSSDSDDEVNCHSTDDHAISTLTWSSDSDEKAELNVRGGLLLTKNGSRNPFKGSVDSCVFPTVSLETLSKSNGPSANTRETAGPLGGKHVRWIDSDSEDG